MHAQQTSSVTAANLPSKEAATPKVTGSFFSSYPARLMTYGLIALASCHLMLLVVKAQGIEYAAVEDGPIEVAQVVLAIAASACLFFATWKARQGRALLMVCACMVAYAAARECDAWFEKTMFDDAYKTIAGAPLFAIAAITLFQNRKQLIADSLDLIRSPAITMFFFAGIHICGVCQLIDQPALWTMYEESWEMEVTKSAIEELAELFGYLLIAFAGIESILWAKASSKSAPAIIRIENNGEAEPAISKAA